MSASANPHIMELEPLVGEWRIDAPFPDTPPGRARFEWMPGGHFLMQHWEVGELRIGDEIVDLRGIAIYSFDPGKQTYLQHYFDSRGVARVYQMSFKDGVWKLWRDTEDFSPLDFAQRFTGTFSADGSVIKGQWEISHDGSTWEKDFDLTYTKID